MSESARVTTSRRRKIKQAEEALEEFDIVEEQPDEVTNSSSDEKEDATDLLLPPHGLEEDSEQMRQRVLKIKSIQLGFGKFLQALDYKMLGLFVKSMLAFYLASALICLTYLIVVYFFFHEQWLIYYNFSVEPRHTEL